jgi:prepilin-type N-terminal cleavage/methylation domain-containing protein/prepilin-type processing-associated H-X9-DG protein
MKKNGGFTLIELLVVIAVIGLLLAIVIPSLSMAREFGKRTVCSSNLKSIGQCLILYAEANDDKLPYNDDPDHPYTAYRGDKEFALHPTGRTPMKLGLLYETGLIDAPKVFYCPSSRLGWVRYESYILPGPWGRLPQTYNTTEGINNWVRVGYCYYPQSVEKDGDHLPLVAAKYERVDRNKTTVTDLIWDFDNLSHVVTGKPRGLNALFGDGHVRFSNDSAAFDPALWADTVRPGTPQFRTILNLLRP